MKEKIPTKFVKLVEPTHRKCKAAAAMDQKDLQVWIAEALENELARRDKEPACAKEDR